MKIRLLKKSSGEAYAVEVDMSYANVRTLARIINTVSGVSDVRVCKLFSGSGNVRAAFKFQSFEYVIMEPWSDSNEY